MFVSKSKYDGVCKELEVASANLDVAEIEVVSLRKKLKKLEKEKNELAEEKEKLLSISTKSQDRNQVTIMISDDMTTIEPIIKFKETANDYLMKIDYVNGTSDHETQIGLMLVAHEGLTQIIESFTERMRDD